MLLDNPVGRSGSFGGGEVKRGCQGGAQNDMDPQSFASVAAWKPQKTNKKNQNVTPNKSNS